MHCRNELFHGSASFPTGLLNRRDADLGDAVTVPVSVGRHLQVRVCADGSLLSDSCPGSSLELSSIPGRNDAATERLMRHQQMPLFRSALVSFHHQDAFSRKGFLSCSRLALPANTLVRGTVCPARPGYPYIRCRAHRVACGAPYRLCAARVTAEREWPQCR